MTKEEALEAAAKALWEVSVTFRDEENRREHAWGQPLYQEVQERFRERARATVEAYLRSINQP